MIGCFFRHEKISDPREFVLWWWKSLNPQFPRSFQIQSMTNLVGVFFAPEVWPPFSCETSFAGLVVLTIFHIYNLIFGMGWNRSSILTSLMQSDSSFSFVEIHQGFLAKKTSVYLPIVDVKWPQQNMVPSAIQNTDNLWCFVSGPRPETVFVGWIKINLQYITDKLIGFIWFYKLEYPNHSLRASWSS